MARRTAAILLALHLCVSPNAANALRRLGPGDAVPDEVLRDPSFSTVRLSELLGPRGGLVVFWASWNPRSPEILRYLAEQQARYAEAGLRVVPVNAEGEGLDRGAVERLAALYASWGLPWPPCFDADLGAYASFGIMTLPTSVYLDRERTILGEYPGFPAEAMEELPELIEKGLGIWTAPAPVRRPAEARYEPRNGSAAVFQTGRLLFRRGMTGKALAAVNEAIERDPEYALAYSAAAFLAVRGGQEARSEAYLVELRRRAPESIEFREALGLALALLGRDDEAVSVLQELLALEEPRPRGLIALGVVQASRGDVDAADEIVRRLGAWEVGGIPLEIDLSAYLDPASSAPGRWSDPERILVQLADLRERGGLRP